MPAHAVGLEAPWDKVADDARKTLVLQLISRKRAPLTTVAALAEELRVPVRTLYRALERWEIAVNGGRAKIRHRGAGGPSTYFVQRGPGGPIKIGRSSQVRARIVQISIACPEELILLGVVQGNHEARFHRLFGAHRIRGEWFRPDPALLGAIEAIASQL